MQGPYTSPSWESYGSPQNKIWNLPDRSTILPKFIYDKEGKLDGPKQIFPARVRRPALILKTAMGFFCEHFEEN